MRGGKREGSGRKIGSNIYGEPTKPVRIPLSMIDSIKEQILSPISSNLMIYNKKYDLPLFSNRVSAGFPTPTDDHLEGSLNLNAYLIQNPETTFFVRVSGDSMIDAHIQDGDLLIVDKSITPKHNMIVLAVIHAEITVKRLILKNNAIALKPENSAYPIIEIPTPEELVIWGVVTNIIHHVK
ncbi:MAG: LexA repressor [Holosporales bacterium]